MNQNEYFGSLSKSRRNAANVFEHFRTDGYKRLRLTINLINTFRNDFLK